MDLLMKTFRTFSLNNAGLAKLLAAGVGPIGISQPIFWATSPKQIKSLMHALQHDESSPSG